MKQIQEKWRFIYFFHFHPDPWGDHPIWRYNIFQVGWFNHQLGKKRLFTVCRWLFYALMWGLWFIMTNHEIRIPINNPLLVWWQPGMLKNPPIFAMIRQVEEILCNALAELPEEFAGQCPTKLSSLWGGGWSWRCSFLRQVHQLHQRIDPPQESANVYPPQMGVSKNKGTPKWMLYNGKNPIKMDDLGVPLFSETSK